MGALRAREASVDIDFDAEVDRKYHIVYGPDLAKPLPPKAWLCKGLGIAPGPPTILGGAGFGGKTMAAQALALAVATGQKAWGHFEVRQGPVLHLDWEQDELTVRRYQRMARAMSIDLADLGTLLGSSLIPDAHLDDPGGYRTLEYLCRGKALCIVDSFRAAFPHAQENDSGVYQHLAMLSSVSKATRCTMLAICHARKMTEGGDDARSSLRGSAALFDASATVYMLDAKKGKPTRVTNTKERNTGKLREDFGLQIIDEQGPRTESSDCEGDIDLEWGLRVRYLSPPELQCEYQEIEHDDNSIALNGDRLQSIGMRILSILTRAPDGLTMPTIRGFLSNLKPSDIAAAMPMLVQTNAVREEGRGSNRVYRAVEREREPGED